MSRRCSLLILAGFLVGLLASCDLTTAPSPPGPGGQEPAGEDAGGCGVERWAIKTGTDPDASSVQVGHVTETTVGQMTSLPVPWSGGNPRPRIAEVDQHAAKRWVPVETTVYRIHATLQEFKEETDSDYHLVIADQGVTMIVEIPDPACVGSASAFKAQIAQTRSKFESQYPQAHGGRRLTHVDQPVVVVGVGFFDPVHGQTGVAPNGVELHPVLGLQFS